MHDHPGVVYVTGTGDHNPQTVNCFHNAHAGVMDAAEATYCVEWIDGEHSDLCDAHAAMAMRKWKGLMISIHSLGNDGTVMSWPSSARRATL